MAANLGDIPVKKIDGSEKLLVGRNAEVVRRFAPDTALDDDRLVAAIEAELK